MALTTSVSNVTVEPVDLYWGNQQMACVEAVVGTGLDATSFDVSSPTTEYYVWYNTGASTDPATAGKTGVEVGVLVADTAAQVAAKTVVAIEAAGTELNSAVYGTSTILIQAKDFGAPLSVWADVDTTMTITVERAGSKLSIGLNEGDITIPFDTQLLDIVAHQTGPEIRGQILLASNVGPISVQAKEAVKTSIDEFLKVPGQAVTPAGGTEVVSIGALAGSRQYSSSFALSRALLLHPTKLAESDRSNDMIFWRAYPKITEILHSGEADKKFTVEFSLFLDELLENPSSKMVYGDWQQNFLKA